MKKIAVIGANGNLGQFIVEAFTNARWQVRAVTRDGQYHFDKGVEMRAADASDANQLIAACEGCDVIFNGLNPLYPQWSKLCMPLAHNVIAAANAHQAIHLFPGNVYNYGTQVSVGFDEKAPQIADTKKGKIRVEMEKLFEQNAQLGKGRTIVLRGGDFYGGTASTSWFNLAVAKKLPQGVMTYPGPMDQIHSWAYLPDFAQTFVKLAERADEFEAFEAFHFTGHAIDGAELKSALTTITGRELKHKGIPWPLLRFFGLFSPMMKEICEMSYLWNVPHRMNETKLEGALGRVPHTQLEDALAATLGKLEMEDILSSNNMAANLNVKSTA